MMSWLIETNRERIDIPALDSRRRSRIRILLADDHHAVRTQMRRRLGHEPDIQVVAEAVNCSQIVDRVRTLKPQVALIDPMMSDGLGLKTIGWLAAYVPETAVVVLTAFVDTALQMELRKIGVRGIVNKGIASTDLIQILRDVGQFTSNRIP